MLYKLSKCNEFSNEKKFNTLYQYIDYELDLLKSNNIINDVETFKNDLIKESMLREDCILDDMIVLYKNPSTTILASPDDIVSISGLPCPGEEYEGDFDKNAFIHHLKTLKALALAADARK